MNATQLDLFSLPVQPYGGVPHRASETSANGARAVAPKQGSLQARVLLALYRTPGLTHAGLDRVLGTEAERSARPRCTELKLAGLIEQDGTCLEDSGVHVSTWRLTAAGEALAREIEGASHIAHGGGGSRTSSVAATRNQATAFAGVRALGTDTAGEPQ